MKTLNARFGFDEEVDRCRMSTRALASRPGVGEVVGVDPSPAFVAKGRELAQSVPNLDFVEGDGRALPLPAESFDVAVSHTTLCHVP
jgi:ubiquinone/menaquinone biosynthesis C-methylase UbiE